MADVSLWRKCRLLACPVRLNILSFLDQNPGQFVKQIADQISLAEDVASKNLQLLAAAGMLISEREGKFNFYRTNAEDPLFQISLVELRCSPLNTERVIRVATALTHERRVGIVAVLREGPSDVTDLCRRLHISRRAIKRHLDKLARRGWLVRDDEMCALSEPDESFAKLLLQCVEPGGTPAQVCRKGKVV